MPRLRLETRCPYCKATLRRGEWIELDIRLAGDDRRGRLGLSPYFGDYRIRPPFDIPEQSVATFFCPHCGADLTIDGECALCAAPLFLLELESGGVIDVCCRRGCPGHALGGIQDPAELRLLMKYMQEADE
ncbi:MAG: hypothetical protein JXQ27_14730 [Acidobacteria bacterium]|nr:hypothetical protein [Acidobacteriota bacterium]